VWENGKYGVTLEDGKNSQVVINDIPAPVTVPQGWNVTFQEERGAPEGSFAFDQLISWTERPEFGIKYFSGSADYTKTIEVSAERLSQGRRVWLDLGQVNDLAEVSVNGESLGVLWKTPFMIDMTDAVVVGSNQVVVTVTNCWKNRIIGDWKVPAAEKITWTLYPFYHDEKDADLMESGLLGPVQLKSTETLKF
jgi:beta-galactosidase/beta-glucuronidase